MIVDYYLLSPAIWHKIEVIYFGSKGLFDGFQVTSMEETSLAGNMPKKGLQRLRWMTSAHSASTKRESIAASQAEATVDAVELQPMQIRTFVISIATL